MSLSSPASTPVRRRGRLGILATHPIQYHAPLHRALAQELDVEVLYAHRQTAAGQAASGFGVAFEWDVPLTEGFRHTFLTNRAAHPSTDTFLGCDTPEVAERIRRGDYDAFLVHGWYTKSHWQAMMACWRSGIPVLVRGDSQLATPRSRLRRLVKEVVYRLFVPRFDGYLVVGERAREYLLHYGADPARMERVPHAVDNAFFRAGADRVDRVAARQVAGAGPEDLVLLFVGKLLAGKRPLDVIEAAAELERRGRQVQVVVAGAGPLESEMRARAAACQVRLHISGFQNQTALPAWYAAADVLVLPSESESWGLVVNEALACGTPAVVSDAVGCAPDLVNDRDPERTGAVFPVGNVGALADAIERLVPHLGTNALATAIQAAADAHAPEEAAQGTLRIVKRLLGLPRRAVPGSAPTVHADSAGIVRNAPL